MKPLRAFATVASTTPPFPKLLAGLLAGLLTGLLAGCGGAGADSGKPAVVASFYPLQYVAERVVGTHAEVVNLTSPGKEPHDLELTVMQTVEVADADVAFYQKGFQPAVDEAIAQNGPDHVVETTEVAALEPTGESGRERDDPHLWLDPIRLSDIAAAFAEEMNKVDPAHAADYEANLDSLQTELARLDREFAEGLGQCEINTVVVSHDAFGYLGKYGLAFESIAGLSPDAEPAPAHIAELHDLIESDAITTVFSETLASPEMSKTIAGDLGIDTAVLDPIEGLSGATEDEDYFSLMRRNLTELQEANKC